MYPIIHKNQTSVCHRSDYTNTDTDLYWQSMHILSIYDLI